MKMTEETNGANEENKDAQNKRPNLRRQILLWAAALLDGLTFGLFGRYVGWTGFYAFAVSCILIPSFSERRLRAYKMLLRRWKWGLIAVAAAAQGLLLGPDSFDWAVGWLRRYETETNLWTFCWRIALECWLAGFAISAAVYILDKKFKLGWRETKKHEDSHPSLEHENTSSSKQIRTVVIDIITGRSSGEAWKLFLTRYFSSSANLVARAPIEETLVYQAIPIGLLSLAGASFGTQVVVSMILFALAHFVHSIRHGIAPGIRGGFYFAFVYARWKRVSFWRAFWMTSLVHALNNSAVVAVGLFFSLAPIPLIRYSMKKRGMDRDELIKSTEEKEGKKSESAEEE